jgi:hypothetical protein
MLVEQLSPPMVAERRRPLGGADDVREQHRGQHPFEVGTAPLAGEELLDVVEQRLGVTDPEHVVRAGELDQRRPLDVRREIATVLDGRGAVVHPVEDQGGHVDDLEDVAHVAAAVDAEEGACRRRARAPVTRPVPPTAKFGVAGEGGHDKVEAPATFVRRVDGVVDHLLGEVGRETPRVVRRLDAAGVRVHEHEGAHPARVGRGHQDREGPDIVRGHERGALRSDRVEHGDRIVHPLLEGRRRRGRNWVREPDAAPVEAHQPAERRQPLGGTGQERLLVPRVSGDEIGVHQHEVEWSVAEHLVGDVDVAALGVSGLGGQAHAPSAGRRRP